MPTFGYPPSYHRILLPGEEHISTINPQPAFVRPKLTSTPADVADAANQNTHIFIPNRQRIAMCTHAYVSYAYVMIFARRQIDIISDLPDKFPPGFAELRRKI